VHAFDAKAVDVLRLEFYCLRRRKRFIYCYFIARYWAWTFTWKSIVEDVHHEEISLLFMNQLNVEIKVKFSDSGF
jgi:hypothetical protein